MQPNMRSTANGSGLYVHIPFCASKCAYCDFYSLPPRNEATVDRYIASLHKELELRAHAETSTPWRTVYIGGGTPSMLNARQLQALIGALGERADGAEFTIEANPEDVDKEWLEQVEQLGVNRVSMGVQSFHDSELKAVGRRHTARRAVEAVELLAVAGMEYSIDLIYGLPEQTNQSWKESLQMVARFKPPHFSAYMLSYEPGTRLHARLLAGKVVEATDDDLLARLDMLNNFASAGNYVHYEVSNFALPGHEAVHNSAYWDGTPYLGLGAGAHSFDGRERSFNPANVNRYIELLEDGRLPLSVEQETSKERLNDLFISSLRTLNGLDPYRLDNFDHEIKAAAIKALGRQTMAGNIAVNHLGHYYIKPDLWPVSDHILRSLLLV